MLFFFNDYEEDRHHSQDERLGGKIDLNLPFSFALSNFYPQIPPRLFFAPLPWI